MTANTATRTNKEWLQALEEPPDPEALEDLRKILLRGLRAALGPRMGGDVEAMAEDFVQEALLKTLSNLHTFRGESRFTTWAQKIAIHIALSELRRRRWKDIPLQTFTQNAEGDEMTPTLLADPTPQPDQLATQRDLMETVEELIFDELTERQRTALLGMLQDGVPLNELAERMDTNPNALYKLLHDARQRLRQRLEEKTGLSAPELLSLFEAE